MNKKYFSIGVFQGTIKERDVSHNLRKTIEQLEIAEAKGLDVLCMPESFLHGYFESKDDALKYSIDLDGNDYKKLLAQFERFHKTTLLLGLNERHENAIYNTVVVIEKGQHIGAYRKAYTYSPYDYFSLGQEFPIFEKNGVKYGIIICVDSIYHEPARILALKGAQLLFCPMFNRVEHNARMLNFLNRKSHFIARAFENECWFAASDIIWENDGKHVCPGSATILDKNGEIVTVGQPFSEGLLQYDIPIELLRNQQKKRRSYSRLLGNANLQKILNAQYISCSKLDQNTID